MRVVVLLALLGSTGCTLLWGLNSGTDGLSCGVPNGNEPRCLEGYFCNNDQGICLKGGIVIKDDPCRDSEECADNRFCGDALTQIVRRHQTMSTVASTSEWLAARPSACVVVTPVTQASSIPVVARMSVALPLMASTVFRACVTQALATPTARAAVPTSASTFKEKALPDCALKPAIPPPASRGAPVSVVKAKMASQMGRGDVRFPWVSRWNSRPSVSLPAPCHRVRTAVAMRFNVVRGQPAYSMARVVRCAARFVATKATATSTHPSAPSAQTRSVSVYRNRSRRLPSLEGESPRTPQTHTV
jgi:hypothetical protein